MKDAFYFPHDSNSRGDPNCVRLRRIAGLAGYGFFWCVVEMLRDEPGYKIPLSRAEDIVFELRAEKDFFEVLFQCELLKKDDLLFWSESLLRRMSVMDEKREQARNAGRASAQKRSSDRSTTVQPESSDRSTTVQPKRVKESKGEKSIEKKECERALVVNPASQEPTLKPTLMKSSVSAYEIPFKELLKEFSRASNGKKTPPMFSEAAKAEITRTWETLLENNCKDPLAVVKAVIEVAMKEMLLHLEKEKTEKAPMFYEPHCIFRDEQFNRYLSTARGSKS